MGDRNLTYIGLRLLAMLWNFTHYSVKNFPKFSPIICLCLPYYSKLIVIYFWSWEDTLFWYTGFITVESNGVEFLMLAANYIYKKYDLTILLECLSVLLEYINLSYSFFFNLYRLSSIIQAFSLTLPVIYMSFLVAYLFLWYAIQFHRLFLYRPPISLFKIVPVKITLAIVTWPA